MIYNGGYDIERELQFEFADDDSDATELRDDICFCGNDARFIVWTDGGYSTIACTGCKAELSAASRRNGQTLLVERL